MLCIDIGFVEACNPTLAQNILTEQGPRLVGLWHYAIITYMLIMLELRFAPGAPWKLLYNLNCPSLQTCKIVQSMIGDLRGCRPSPSDFMNPLGKPPHP